MAEQTDEKDDSGARAALGLVSVASAVLASPRATGVERTLATEVIRTSEIGDHHKVAEIESVAVTWNRQMDVVLDAANASAGKRDRSSRRSHMARALDEADLMLIERRLVADLLEPKIKFAGGGELVFSGDPAELAIAGLECVDFIEQDPRQAGCS